jgi:potassium efflux system protein
LAIALVVWGGTLGLGSPAQEPSPSPEPAVETVTAEEIQAIRQQAEGAADLDDATKQKILQACDQAVGMLDAAAKSAARTAELQRAIDAAPDQLRNTEERLSALPAAPPAVQPGDKDLDQLKQILADKEKELQSKNEALSALRGELDRRVGGQKEISEALTAAQQQLETVEKELLIPVSPDVPPLLVSAQRALLLAQRQAITQSIAAYQKELAMYEATRELLPLEQRLAAEEVSLLEEEVSQWRELVNRRVEVDAKTRAARARTEALRADPALKQLAMANSRLAEKGEEAASINRTESKRLEAIQKELADVESQFNRTKQRYEAIGLTNAIGVMMRTRRAALPDVADHYRAIRARQPVIRDVQAKLFELEDQRAATANLEKHLESTLGQIRPEARHIPEYELELAVRDYLTKQRDHLDTAIRNHYDCFKTLVDLDEAEHKLIRAVEEYTDYIDERVLWIRSAEPMQLWNFRVAAGIVKRLLNQYGAQGWVELGQSLKTDFGSRPLVHLAAILLFAPWLIGQRRLRNWLSGAGELAASRTGYEILPTLKALLLTVLVAATWPALLWYLSWRLVVPFDATDFGRAVASGLAHAAAWFFPLEFFRQLCRPKGVAEAHFDWPAGALRMVRRHLRWFVLAGLPLVFTIVVLESQGIDRWPATLGRIAFMAMMLLIAVFVQLVLRPGGGLFRYLLAGGYRGWFYRFRHLWYALGTATPLSLAVLAGVGYLYTAHRLAARLRQTVLLPLALVVVGALLSRWVLIVRRRLAIQRSRQRRRAAGAPEATIADPSGIASIPMAAELEPDLSAVSLQTRRFINSFLVLAAALGIWWIWVEILPALAILDEVELWPTTVEVTERVTAADGTTSYHTIEQLSAITLADLGVAVLIFLMTAVAARNIPGLLEIAIPQRLSLDAGVRYAITTLTRYVVIAIGLIMGFGALGIGWSKVQWLVAALGVGLGFGLQEIFANFISGLIILFERPIRVGDIVTVADVTGVVTRVQIRATTVTNWDRQEFIVPNKEFITGRLLNWTRADRVNRVVINVGIAYGSNTEQARELLLRVLDENPEVLSDPAPLVTFEGFGDSSLTFVVRCYLPSLEKRLQTIHELHTAIDQAFREARIEIAFPQRDLHLRSGAELLEKAFRPPTEKPQE